MAAPASGFVLATDGAAEPPRKLLPQALVPPVAVTVPGELGHDDAEMLFAGDQDVTKGTRGEACPRTLSK